MIIPWPIYYPQFPPKLTRLSAIPAKTLTTESVQDWVRVPLLAGWTVVHKNIAYIRVKIFDVCQEHLTGFDLILICWTTKIQALKPPCDHDHHKHWTFSLKTLNFVMRIDHYLRQFILSYKRRYWMSPPFTNRSPRFVKHGLRPRFSGPVQSGFYKFSPRFVKHGHSPVRSSPVRLLQHATFLLAVFKRNFPHESYKEYFTPTL
jgi:hypothetical protein